MGFNTDLCDTHLYNTIQLIRAIIIFPIEILNLFIMSYKLQCSWTTCIAKLILILFVMTWEKSYHIYNLIQLNPHKLVYQTCSPITLYLTVLLDKQNKQTLNLRTKIFQFQKKYETTI